MTLSITAIFTQYCYAEYNLSWVSFMMSVTNQPNILSVVAPS
jgi:hypothetical protein